MKRLIPIFIFVFVANTLLAYDFKQKQICYSIMTLGESDTPVAVVSQQEATADNYKRITELVIPETVKYKGTEYPVAAIADSAFHDATSLTSITLPAAIVSIQASAFLNCTSLKQVTCVDGSKLQTIADDAFSGCTSLTDLNLGHKLQHIGQRAFISCTSLQTINLGNALKRINERAFAHCTALTSFTVPVSTEYLGKNVFEGCTALTSFTFAALSCRVEKDYMPADIKTQITSIRLTEGVENISAHLCQGMTKLQSVSMPSSVKTIGEHAFSGCTALKEIALPETLKEIHEHAFDGCTGLSHIRIPKNVTTLHPMAFHGCSSLTSIEWCPADFKSNTDKAVFEPIAAQVTKFTFAPSVVTVPSHLCQGMTSLSSVSLPDYITKIGDYAFERCSAMQSIMFPDNLQTIGSGAFSACTSLTSVRLPNTVTTCGSGAFEGCTQLRSFTFSNRMTSISSKMFKGCSSLLSIELPASISNIGSEALANCNSLTTIHCSNCACEMANNALANCSATIILPYKSPDLKMVLARGNVKSIVYKDSRYDDYEATVNYTPDGENEEYLADVLCDLSRNDFGQITYSSDCGSEYEWTYNGDGFIATYVWIIGLSSAGDSEYEYNEKNELVKETRHGISQGEEWDAVKIYSNYKYDSRGNWISRDVKVTGDGTSKSYTETREITYYASDLKMVLARGNVKSIVPDANCVYYAWGETNYNRHGINVEELESVFERNELGQITSYYESDSYTYNKDGFIAEFVSWVENYYKVSKYEYNEKNEIIKEVEKIYMDNGDGVLVHDAVFTYSNYKYDSNGNWISRDVKVEQKKKYANEIPVFNISGPKYDTNVTHTETRKITFYE